MTAVAEVPGNSRPAAPSTSARTRNVRAEGSLAGTRAETRPGGDSPASESANTWTTASSRMAAKRSWGACTSSRTRSVATNSMTGVPRATHSPASVSRRATTPENGAGTVWRRNSSACSRSEASLAANAAAASSASASRRASSVCGRCFSATRRRASIAVSWPRRSGHAPRRFRPLRARAPARPQQIKLDQRGAGLDPIARIHPYARDEPIDPWQQACTAFGRQRTVSLSSSVTCAGRSFATATGQQPGRARAQPGSRQSAWPRRPDTILDAFPGILERRNGRRMS